MIVLGDNIIFSRMNVYQFPLILIMHHNFRKQIKHHITELDGWLLIIFNKQTILKLLNEKPSEEMVQLLYFFLKQHNTQEKIQQIYIMNFQAFNYSNIFTYSNQF